MKSFALYYKKKEEIETPILSSAILAKEIEHRKASEYKQCVDISELHVNLWKVEQGKFTLKPKYYFDFGIKISSHVGELCLYLPFTIDIDENHKDDLDLGRIIANRKDILCAIFNDDISPSIEENECYCKLCTTNCTSCFYLFTLGAENFTEVKKTSYGGESGTKIKLKIKGTHDGKETNPKSPDIIYIRFRVPVSNKSDIIRSENLSNDLLQAAFSKTDLFDFRFNEKREIHMKIQEEMKENGFDLCHFDKIHFFYIADTREEVNNGSSLKIDSRLLEQHVWERYEPLNELIGTNFVAHHWKVRVKDGDKPIPAFSLFFTTKYPELDGLRLISYLFVAILLGWMGSMLCFKLNELNIPTDWIIYKQYIRPIVIFIMGCVIGYLLAKSNLAFQWFKIRRKR